MAYRLTRHCAADPASVALLLAGPSTVADDALAEPSLLTTDVAGDTGTLRVVSEGARAGVLVAAPRRGGVGFVATVDVTDARGVASRGTITVHPADDAGCDIDVTVWPSVDASEASMQREARSFLDDLVKRARSRAFAA